MTLHRSVCGTWRWCLVLGVLQQVLPQQLSCPCRLSCLFLHSFYPLVCFTCRELHTFFQSLGLCFYPLDVQLFSLLDCCSCVFTQPVFVVPFFSVLVLHHLSQCRCVRHPPSSAPVVSCFVLLWLFLRLCSLVLQSGCVPAWQTVAWSQHLSAWRQRTVSTA